MWGELRHLTRTASLGGVMALSSFGLLSPPPLGAAVRSVVGRGEASSRAVDIPLARHLASEHTGLTKASGADVCSALQSHNKQRAWGTAARLRSIQNSRLAFFSLRPLRPLPRLLLPSSNSVGACDHRRGNSPRGAHMPFSPARLTTWEGMCRLRQPRGHVSLLFLLSLPSHGSYCV